jgi:hypothetical protein
MESLYVKDCKLIFIIVLILGHPKDEEALKVCYSSATVVGTGVKSVIFFVYLSC